MGIDWVMWLRSHWFGNDEIRNPKHETRNKFKIRMPNEKNKRFFLGGSPRSWTLEFWSFDIVSKPGTHPKGGESKQSADNFEFRIWGLLIFGME